MNISPNIERTQRLVASPPPRGAECERAGQHGTGQPEACHHAHAVSATCAAVDVRRLGGGAKPCECVSAQSERQGEPGSARSAAPRSSNERNLPDVEHPWTQPVLPVIALYLASAAYKVESVPVRRVTLSIMPSLGYYGSCCSNFRTRFTYTRASFRTAPNGCTDRSGGSGSRPAA